MKTHIAGPLAAPYAGGNRVRILSGRDTFGGRLAVVETVARRGHEPPLRRHRHEDLLVHVVAGHLAFQIDGCRVPAPPGSCVSLPRGTEHGYALVSETAHLLVILAPAGAEECLADLHRLGDAVAPGSPAGSDEAVERLIASVSHFGIEITGPPPVGLSLSGANAPFRGGSRCAKVSQDRGTAPRSDHESDQWEHPKWRKRRL